MSSGDFSRGSGDGLPPPSEGQGQGGRGFEPTPPGDTDGETLEEWGDLSGIHKFLREVAAGSTITYVPATAEGKGALIQKGDTVGQYKIERWIAGGGMGEVYVATGPDGADVAVKMCSDRTANHSKIRKQIEHVKQVVEENPDADIVTIYDMGVHRGRFWYAMRRMDGDLRSMLVDLRSDPRECAHVLARVARALHLAHTNNIVHRDLKPGNILVSRDGRGGPLIAISDFDVSRPPPGKGNTSDSTGGAAVVGTFDYFSPEQAAGRAQTPVGDVYAFGVILYEILSGHTPSRAKNILELLEKIRHEPPAAPVVSSEPIPKKLALICMKCLEKAPGDRYGSAKEVAEDIDRALANRQLSIQTGAFGRIGDYRRRHPFLSAFMILAVFVLAYGARALIDLARARGVELVKEAVRANQFQAKLLAVEVEYRLKQYGDALAKAAAGPEFRDALRARTSASLEDRCESLRASFNDEQGRRSLGLSGDQRWSVENLFVVDAAGFMKAVSPPNPKVLGMNFSHRDYYLGVMRDGGVSNTFHISKVYKAFNDGKYKFAISVPIRREERPGSPAAGLLVAAFAITSSMGLEYFYDRDTVVAFAGPPDPNSEAPGVPGPSVSSKYMLLLHPAYRARDKRAEPLTFTPPASWLTPAGAGGRGPEPLTSMHYNDPAAEIDPDLFGGRWVASYAPVGLTRYVMVVQKRYASITSLPNRVVELYLWTAGYFVVSCGLVALIVTVARRDRRRKSAVTSPG